MRLFARSPVRSSVHAISSRPVAPTAPARRGQGGRGSALVAVAALVLSAGAAPGGIPEYVGVGTFTVPSASFVYDALPDGRLVGVSATGQILRQDSPAGSAFTPIGQLPAGVVPSFGAGFARLSPSGSRLAIGDNGVGGVMTIIPLGSVSLSPPTVTSSVTVFNYQADWIDEDTLYVSGSPSFGQPTKLYRASVSTGSSTEVVNQIGDGSGGVAIGSGIVYTAIGFDLAGARDGEIRGFDLAALNSAAAPVPFTSGQTVGRLNTAATLDFDGFGNLIVAGFGGVGLIDPASGLTRSLPGLDPAGFYSASFSPQASEILVQQFGSATVLRFAIPSPASAGLLVALGVFSARRRR